MASLMAVLRSEWMPMPRLPSRVDPGRLAVFLDQPPGGLAVQVAADQVRRVRRHRPEQGTLAVVLDAGPPHVVQDRPGRVEQDLAALLIAFLGDVEVVLDAVGLE